MNILTALAVAKAATDLTAHIIEQVNRASDERRDLTDEELDALIRRRNAADLAFRTELERRRSEAARARPAPPE